MSIFSEVPSLALGGTDASEEAGSAGDGASSFHFEVMVESKTYVQDEQFNVVHVREWSIPPTFGLYS
jgi:hypothetical protein